MPREFTENDRRKAQAKRSQKRANNVKRAHELKKEGWTNGKIAKELKVKAQSVRLYLKEQPLPDDTDQ